MDSWRVLSSGSPDFVPCLFGPVITENEFREDGDSTSSAALKPTLGQKYVSAMNEGMIECDRRRQHLFMFSWSWCTRLIISWELDAAEGLDDLEQ